MEFDDPKEMGVSEDSVSHYRQPNWFTRNVFNRAVAGFTRAGLSIWGSRVLEVPGRTSGRLQRVPVNLLSFDGNHYLVSARGNGQWVRNVRAAGGHLDLVVGRKRQHWFATELDDTDKSSVLRAYLQRWKAEVGVFFDGVTPKSTDAEFHAIAPKHPVFILGPVPDRT